MGKKSRNRELPRLSLDLALKRSSTCEFARGAPDSGLERNSTCEFASVSHDKGLKRDTNSSVRSIYTRHTSRANVDWLFARGALDTPLERMTQFLPIRISNAIYYKYVIFDLLCTICNIFFKENNSQVNAYCMRANISRERS